MVELFIVPEERFTISYDAKSCNNALPMVDKEFAHIKYNFHKGIRSSTVKMSLFKRMF